VISETMRLHAPAPLLIPRETTEDTELLGHRVPARTRVVINAWAIGRDPAAWERAEEFVPERFVGGVGAPPVEYSYSKVCSSSSPNHGLDKLDEMDRTSCKRNQN
jgi:cytochrome P450